MDPPVSPGSRAVAPSPRRSWPTGLRCWTSPRYRHASISSRCEARPPHEDGAPPRAGARPLGRQRRHGERRPDRPARGRLSHPRPARHRRPRRAPLQGDDHGAGRALRAAQSAGVEFPVARRARRRRNDFAEDRRAGKGVFDGTAADGDRGGPVTERVAVTLVDGVLTGTLNRPEKKNAIDSRMMDELAVLFERAELEAAVRVVVLRGAGKDFCAGMDLTELLESADRTVEQNRAAALRFGGVFLQMRSLPKPVIAVVQGRALAGGCGLATACDLVLAADSAQFGYPEVQRGFVPALVMNMLRRAVGEKIAFDLSATGRLVTAREAERAGLVSRVLPDAEFETGVEQIVRGIAALSPTALALTKQQLYRLDGVGFEDGIRLSADVNAVSRTTPDFRSAISAFLQR